MSEREILSRADTADRLEQLFQAVPEGQPTHVDESTMLNVLGHLRSHPVPERVEGVMVSCHLDEWNRYEGSYGVIQIDEKTTVVWSARQIYRNCSHPKVGSRYSFVVIDGSFASAIDQIDKEPRRWA